MNAYAVMSYALSELMAIPALLSVKLRVYTRATAFFDIGSESFLAYGRLNVSILILNELFCFCRLQ